MAFWTWALAAVLIPAAGLEAMADSPHIVAPGVVSSDAPEFGTSVDGRTGRIYFNRIGEGMKMQLWAADRAGSTWRSAHKLSIADDRYNDTDPFVSRSGDRLYFASNRPRPGSDTPNARSDDDLWYLEREGSGWSRPIWAGEAVNSAASESSASEDRAGNLYFSRRQGDASQILAARRSGKGFGPAREISLAAGRFGNVAVSSDGRTLVLAGGASGAPPSLWVARRVRGKWGAARELSFGGEAMARFAPYLSNDGRTLYFTGERPVAGQPRGQRDIYAIPFGGRK